MQIHKYLQASMLKIEDTIEAIKKKGYDHILVINISSGLSGIIHLD